MSTKTVARTPAKEKPKTSAEQASPKPLTLSDVRITWPREDAVAEHVHKIAGEITGPDLARILGILDRMRHMAPWGAVFDPLHAHALLAGVNDILTTITGTYGELETDGLGILQDAVEEAHAILEPRALQGPEAFTVHLTPAA